MADRAGSPPDFESWVRWVEQKFAALDRGDSFAGTVSVGRLLVGNMYLDDVRDVTTTVDPNRVPGFLLTDKNTGATCFIPVPCPDTDNPGAPTVPDPSWHWPTAAGRLTTSVSDNRSVDFQVAIQEAIIDVTGFGGTFTLNFQKNGVTFLPCTITGAGVNQHFPVDPNAAPTLLPTDTLTLSATGPGGCGSPFGVFARLRMIRS